MLNINEYAQTRQLEQNPNAFTIIELIAAIRTHKFMVSAAVLVGVLTCYALSQVITPRYTAEAVLVADLPSSRIFDIVQEGQQTAADLLAMRTIVETIGAPPIIERAVQKLPADVRTALEHTALHQGRSSLTLCPAFLCQAFTRSADASSNEDGSESSSRDVERLINHISGRLDVNTGGRSYTIQVRYTSEDPVLSAAVTNVIVNEYLAFTTERKRQIYVHTGSTLAIKIDSLRHELQSAERNAQMLREQVRIQELRSGALTGSKQEQVISGNAEAYANARDAEREAQAIAAVYERFLLRQREAEGRQDLPGADAWLLSIARPPLKPSGLGTSLFLGLGAVAGFFVGVSGAAVRYRRNRSAVYE